MRSREATWEKRNLGVTAYEFFIDINETPEEVMPEICACEAEYQTLHIASGNTGVLLEAQKEGFRFIEASIEMEVSASKLIFPQIYERFKPYLSYSIANENEIKDVINIVTTGTMFTTDKIACDPYFGPEKSGLRYSYWIQDMLNQGATLIITKYKNNPIGFNIGIVEKDGTIRGELGGRFPDFDDKGLGFVFVYMLLQWMLDMGGKRMEISMSSNNLPMVKLYETFGFTAKAISYILIKHLS